MGFPDDVRGYHGNGFTSVCLPVLDVEGKVQKADFSYALPLKGRYCYSYHLGGSLSHSGMLEWCNIRDHSEGATCCVWSLVSLTPLRARRDGCGDLHPRHFRGRDIDWR